MRIFVSTALLLSLAAAPAFAGPRPTKAVAVDTAARWLSAVKDFDAEDGDAALALTAATLEVGILREDDPDAACGGRASDRDRPGLLTCAGTLGDDDAPAPWTSRAWKRVPSPHRKPLRALARGATLVFADSKCQSGSDRRVAIAVTLEGGQPKVRGAFAFVGYCGE